MEASAVAASKAQILREASDALIDAGMVIDFTSRSWHNGWKADALFTEYSCSLAPIGSLFLIAAFEAAALGCFWVQRLPS